MPVDVDRGCKLRQEQEESTIGDLHFTEDGWEDYLYWQMQDNAAAYNGNRQGRLLPCLVHFISNLLLLPSLKIVSPDLRLVPDAVLLCDLADHPTRIPGRKGPRRN